MCCKCATTAVAAMMRTNAVTSTVTAVMVMAKVGMMTTAAKGIGDGGNDGEDDSGDSGGEFASITKSRL